MHRFFLLLLFVLFTAVLNGAKTNANDPLVVVSTRYLRAEGVSHSHLYLYKEDGAFLRQLTEFEKGQDHDPLFSPDGREIVFLHTPDSDDEGGKGVVDAKSPTSVETWRIETSGKGLEKLLELPNWYRMATNVGYFDQCPGKSSPDNQPRFGQANKGWTSEGNPWPDVMQRKPSTLLSSNGVFELTLYLGPDDMGGNGPGNGQLYELRNLKSGKIWRLGELPGFLGLTDLLHESSNPEQLFLQQGDLSVVFFSLHMGSTFGEACIALNLNKPSLLMLPGHQVVSHDDGKVPTTDNKATWKGCMDNSGNATPIPLPGEPCFLTLGANRYEPIPGSQKTANISYLTRFDAELNGTPYVLLHAAPIFYGASLYRPDKSPAVMKIGENIGRD